MRLARSVYTYRGICASRDIWIDLDSAELLVRFARVLGRRTFLALGFLLVSGTVQATTGGPDALELLGYDVADEKLYFVHVLGGETDSVELHYLLVRGPNAGRRIVAKSWDGSVLGDPAYVARLAQLKSRLVPLRPDRLPSLQQKRLKRVSTVVFPGDPPWQGWRVQLSVRQGKRRASKQVVIYREKARLLTAWRVPSRGTLVLVQYLGIPYEFGYETEDAIWLPDP